SSNFARAHAFCFFSVVVDPKAFEKLLPIAVQWAKKQEEFVLKHGNLLSSRHIADAALSGVTNPARIRVLVVDRIPLPDDPDLAEASKRIGIVDRKSVV